MQYVSTNEQTHFSMPNGETPMPQPQWIIYVYLKITVEMTLLFWKIKSETAVSVPASEKAKKFCEAEAKRTTAVICRIRRKMASSSIDSLILKLHDVDAVKFGEYMMKSGMLTPIYIDLRVLVSYPALMNQVPPNTWCVGLLYPAAQRG